MQKRLYRSRKERMIGGVCGGLAEYFNIDPTIIRLIFVITIFFGGLGIISYIILAIVTPTEDSSSSEPRETIRENVQEIKQTAENIGQDIHSTFSSRDSTRDNPVENREHREYPHYHRSGFIIGIIVLIVGIIALLSTVGLFNVFGWITWAIFWPLILIAIGLLIIFGRRR